MTPTETLPESQQQNKDKVVYLADKDMSISFPSSMNDDQISSAIRSQVYGKEQAPEVPEEGKEPFIQGIADRAFHGFNVSLEQVISIYSNIVERFEKRNGKIATVLSIPAELDHLEYAADRLYAENIQTIIMGHTHIPAIISQHEGTYANTGYWGSDPENETWIEVENNMKPILYKFSQLNL